MRWRQEATAAASVTAGQQREALDLLARRSRLHLDAGRQHVIRFGEDQPALTAREEPAEYGRELARGVVEGGGERFLDSLVNLADHGQQVATSRLEILELVAEEAQPFLQRGVLLERERVDPAKEGERPLSGAQPLLLLLADVRDRDGLIVAVGRHRDRDTRAVVTQQCFRLDAVLLDGARLELLGA